MHALGYEKVCLPSHFTTTFLSDIDFYSRSLALPHEPTTPPGWLAALDGPDEVSVRRGPEASAIHAYGVHFLAQAVHHSSDQFIVCHPRTDELCSSRPGALSPPQPPPTSNSGSASPVGAVRSRPVSVAGLLVPARHLQRLLPLVYHRCG